MSRQLRKYNFFTTRERTISEGWHFLKSDISQKNPSFHHPTVCLCVFITQLHYQYVSVLSTNSTTSMSLCFYHPAPQPVCLCVFITQLHYQYVSVLSLNSTTSMSLCYHPTPLPVCLCVFITQLHYQYVSVLSPNSTTSMSMCFYHQARLSVCLCVFFPRVFFSPWGSRLE
jgi:hypothetical protein